jgi:hypothetical protein
MRIAMSAGRFCRATLSTALMIDDLRKVHIATVTPTLADDAEPSAWMFGKEIGPLTCHCGARHESI